MPDRLPYQRANRVGDLLRKELAECLRTELKDPRIGFVSVTEVVVSPDLRTAKAYVSVYGSAEAQKTSLEGLQSAAGFVRKLLGRKLYLKRIPEITFYLDESIAYGARINAALANLKD